MTISHNELLSLFKRVFEVLYGNSADFDALAKNQLSLEKLGLGGWYMLARSLPDLEKKTSIILGSDSGSGDTWRIDANNNNLMAFAPSISDILIDRAMKSGRCNVEIVNARDVVALAPVLSQISGRGFAAIMNWSEEASSNVHIAEIEPNMRYPSLKIFEDVERKTFLKIIIAPDMSECVEFLRTSDPMVYRLNVGGTESFQISSEEFEDRYQSGLNDGLIIDQNVYKKLCSYAERILVEASDSSRSGAGE
jgi:hypothetical protein